MNLRVAIWNMNHWQRSTDARTHAWEYLASELQPDICLLQEFIPEGKKGSFHFVHSPFSSKSPWGTTVVSFSRDLKDLEIAAVKHGSITGAEFPSTPLDEFAFISVYGIVEGKYATHNMHHVFSDLTIPLLGKLKGRSVIIGGDFNTSTQWEEGGKRWPGSTPSILFSRIEDFGLINLTMHFYGKHVHTYRHKTSNRPWQNDYVFVSKELVKNATRCEVISNSDVESLSDHNPIIVEFDIG